MELIKKYKKQLIGILIFSLFFVISDIILITLNILGLNLSKLPNFERQIALILVMSVFMVILILVYKKDMIEDLKKFKKNYRYYIEVGIILYIIGIVGMVVSNLFIQQILGLGIASNEEGVRNLIQSVPIYMVFATCIAAPFQEEMIFRKIIRDIVSHKIIYVVVSGLAFGLVHILGTEITSILDFVYIIPYGFLGAIFALIYVKTDNLWNSIFVHFIHNSVLVFLQLKLSGII